MHGIAVLQGCTPTEATDSEHITHLINGAWSPEARTEVAKHAYQDINATLATMPQQELERLRAACSSLPRAHGL